MRVPVCFATHSGGQTIDCDEAGGNPFATALIELAFDAGVEYADFPAKLYDRTKKLSGGIQTPEWHGPPPDIDWRLLRPGAGGQINRAALVLIVSDYDSPHIDSLEGAAFDEQRISAMLEVHGFSAIKGVRPTLVGIGEALDIFEEVSATSDMAIVYSTGHGYEYDGRVYLVPGDFPFAAWTSPADLDRHAVKVESLADACCARVMNLVFFAGCRTV